ncbi:MAG: hypothetical protein Q4E21_03685 [Clostridia bacterium]|nr:hypothetical protein [Clostridia bacterium]
MKWRKNLFSQKEQQEVPPIPPFDEIVELMFDKGLNTFANQVVKVIYSKNKTMRYVILKNENGLFTYRLEKIYPFDADEWKYISGENNALPAMWEPFQGICGKSVFANEKDLLREMQTEPEYRRYFS